MLTKKICNFNSYRECFENMINEIKKIEIYKTCNRIDNGICKKCEIGNIIDEITQSEINGEECPICYKKLSLRYLHICSDNRHKICNKCYNMLEINMDIMSIM